MAASVAEEASGPVVQNLVFDEPNVAGFLPYHAVDDLATLSSLLVRDVSGAGRGRDTQAGRRALLDAFLSAAGMSQVLDDHLHRDAWGLRRVAKYACDLPGPSGWVVAGGLRFSDGCLRAFRALVAERRLHGLARRLRDLTAHLARSVAPASEGGAWEGMQAEANRVASEVSRSPARLQRTLAIPPRCFFSFDQRPEDCERLAVDFARRWPDRTMPLLVVGVRTSGSYLAPVVAAYLERLGYEQVEHLSWRPGQPALASERGTIRRLASTGGLALVVDDPPTSGGSLARVAADIERLGVPAHSVVFLMQVFDSPAWWAWPARLRGREMVLLAQAQWAVQERLTDTAVRKALEELLVDSWLTVAGRDEIGPRIKVRALVSTERLPAAVSADVGPFSGGRGHVRSVFRVRLQDGGGRVHVHHVLVRGAGLGRYGDQAAAVAQRLEAHVPETYGVVDGMLYRAWLPEASRASTDTCGDRLAARAVEYVAARRTALPVAEDLATRTEGHDAVWESCSRWMGALYGRLALPLRPILRRASRRLLAAPSACLIDGQTRLSDWFAADRDPDGVLVKAGFEDHAFRYQIPFSYDPSYDLAAAAAAHHDPALGDFLRRAYTRLTDEPIGEERWFLQRLLSLREQRDLVLSTHAAYDRHVRRQADDAAEVVAPSRSALVWALSDAERAMSRIHERYFGDAYLGDLPHRSSSTGRLCAVDVDGVLETPHLSYAGITQAGAVALRALTLHGYRPVLATGRSLDEVRERCAAYRLAGGVAEYGAAVYDHNSGREVVLLDARQQAELDLLRLALTRMPGVVVDDRYRHGVRAFRLAGAGRCGLEPEVAADVLKRLGLEDRIRPVGGWKQTDFTAVRVDKGTGLRALAKLLGAPSEGRFLALAVGDSEPDLAMFGCAELACAPANADRSVSAAAPSGVTMLSRPYQVGLLQAVARLLDHNPWKCSTCAPPREDGDRRLLGALLAVQDRRRTGKLVQSFRVALYAALL